MTGSDIKLKWKFVAAFSAVIAIVLLMAGSTYLSLDSIKSATTANNHSALILTQVNTALSTLVEEQNAVRGYIGTGDASFLKRINSFHAAFDDAAEQIQP